MDHELRTIIKDCKAGSHPAFKAMHDRYYRVMLGIALRYTGNGEEARDVLQESFIKIFNNITSYNEQGSFEGWIKRIVQNTALNHQRSRYRFESWSDQADEETGPEDGSELSSSLELKQVLALLQKLPAGYRTIINLHIIDGYSHQEISAMLGISPGTSKSQLFKARQLLVQMLNTDMKALNA